MTKQIKVDLRYDGASLDQVTAMLADQSFREQVCDAQGVLRKTVTITPRETPGGHGMAVLIDQVQTAQGVPSFAQKFVGSEIQIVQDEEWESPVSATVQVTIPGKPGDMSGTVAVREVDGGVTETVEMQVKVGIPLVGGKLEGLIADLLTKALHAENKVGKEWLAGS